MFRLGANGVGMARTATKKSMQIEATTFCYSPYVSCVRRCEGALSSKSGSVRRPAWQWYRVAGPAWALQADMARHLEHPCAPPVYLLPRCAQMGALAMDGASGSRVLGHRLLGRDPHGGCCLGSQAVYYLVVFYVVHEPTGDHYNKPGAGKVTAPMSVRLFVASETTPCVPNLDRRV